MKGKKKPFLSFSSIPLPALRCPGTRAHGTRGQGCDLHGMKPPGCVGARLLSLLGCRLQPGEQGAAAGLDALGVLMQRWCLWLW